MQGVGLASSPLGITNACKESSGIVVFYVLLIGLKFISFKNLFVISVTC